MSDNYFTKGNVFIDNYVQIEDSVMIDAGEFPGSVKIGKHSKIKRLTTIHSYNGKISIGDRVSIGEQTVLYGHGGINIGDNSILGPGVIIPASMHIFSSVDTPIRFQGETAFGVNISEDVWIGARAVILDGVTIGKGAVIGAGAVVKAAIPPFAIAVGVPAKIVRYRNGGSNE